MYSLYSPPNGNFPQELPDYWRFDDGTIRTDLPSLSKKELNTLGWEGPFTLPIAKNSEDETQTSWDYDPETHKYIWNSQQRKFQIIEKHLDESEFLDSIPIPEWGRFRVTALESEELNNLFTVAPLAAASLPAVVMELSSNKYDNFRTLWTLIKKKALISDALIQNLKALAESCNLPEEFIEIL